MSLELVAIIAVLLVVAVSVIAPRVGVAAPLLLVVLGLAVNLLPFVERVVVPPEWILGGILPPLLYSAAVNTPTMEFRRDFRLISVFSVVLVVASSLLVGSRPARSCRASRSASGSPSARSSARRTRWRPP